MSEFWNTRRWHGLLERRPLVTLFRKDTAWRVFFTPGGRALVEPEGLLLGHD
jgi:hypothetical protein